MHSSADPLCPTRLAKNRPSKAQPPSPAGSALGFEERLALFACALGRESALEVLEGLCEPSRARARAHARAVSRWDSPTRQAKVEAAFGVCPNADEQLRALMRLAAPRLQQAIYRLLPRFQRSLFPAFTLSPCSGEPLARGGVALAERLVREATR